MELLLVLSLLTVLIVAIVLVGIAIQKAILTVSDALQFIEQRVIELRQDLLNR